MQFVVFLRGINVGGNVLIKMAELKKDLEKAGFKKVQTILASGNVVLDAAEKDSRKVAQKIEDLLKKKYKRDIRVIARPIRDIEMLSRANPFRGIAVTKETRLYVTFLDKKPAKHLKTVNEFFRVVKTYPFAICSVLVLTADRPGRSGGTLDLMGSLEKHYGKDITTRNWNTLQKILKAVV